MKLSDQIAHVLRQHQGRENAIRSREIAERIGLPPSADRAIREAIADEDWEARELLVVAIPGCGYYVATDIAEADAYVLFLTMLRDRAVAKLSKFRTAARLLGIHLQP